MESLNINIANLKCHGCANTIKTNLKEIDGVANIDINVEDNLVNISGNQLNKETILAKLTQLGYPEIGSDNKFQHKVKSYVSCAIGRMSKEA